MASKVLFDLNYFFTIFLVILYPTATTSSDSNKVKNNVGSNIKDPIKDYILCRRCGADLADPKKIINHLSPEATVITNQTLFERKGVEVQLLQNPLGIKFRSITLENTKCTAVHNWQYEFSWYPGFAWKPCICQQCRAHHGWYFEPKGAASLDFSFPSGRGFYMLKLNNLQSENCKDVHCEILDYCAEIVFKLSVMELSKEQLEFLSKCEEEFKDRYTERDEEFMKIKESDAIKPPIVDSWPSGNQRSNNWNRQNQDRNWHDRDRNRQRDRYRERDNYRDRERDVRYAGKHHLYQRSYKPN